MTATAATGAGSGGGGSAGPILKKGALGLWDDTVIAVSSTAPAYSIATSMGLLGVAVLLAGPAIIWVAFIPVTGIAFAYYYMNRVEPPNCGAAYHWAAKALGPVAGFSNGWVVIMTDLFFMAFAGPQGGAALLQLFNAWGVTSIGGMDFTPANTNLTIIVGVGFLALVTYMVLVGIKIAATFQWLLLAIEYVIVLGFSIIGFFHKGGSGFTLDWLNPLSVGGWGPFAQGMVVAVFFYWGWDTAANLNEETEDGSLNPGKAGIIGMFLLLVLFLIASISIQETLTPAEIQANSATTLTAFADKMVGQQWGSLAILAFLSSTVATLQTTLLPSVRTAFSMGRDGMLGPMWAVVHPKWQTPWIGTLVMGGLAAGISLLTIGLGSSLGAIVGAGVNAIGLLVAFYYGMVGIACVVYYRHSLTNNIRAFVFAGVFPLFGALSLFGVGIYDTWYLWTGANGTFAVSASNGEFEVLVPAVVLIAAVPIYLYQRARRHPASMNAKPEVAPANALA